MSRFGQPRPGSSRPLLARSDYPPRAPGFRHGERSYGPVSSLGTRVVRTEDPKFLTTGGVYTEDVVDERLAGACHVFFVRSPIAHARITNVDVSAALEAPGVVAAFTGQDLADLPEIPPSAAGLMNGQMKQR